MIVYLPSLVISVNQLLRQEKVTFAQVITSVDLAGYVMCDMRISISFCNGPTCSVHVAVSFLGLTAKEKEF